jgi:hypothetical protein
VRGTGCPPQHACAPAAPSVLGRARVSCAACSTQVHSARDNLAIGETTVAHVHTLASCRRRVFAGSAVLVLARHQCASEVQQHVLGCFNSLALRVKRCGIKAWPHPHGHGRKQACWGTTVVANVTGALLLERAAQGSGQGWARWRDAAGGGRAAHLSWRLQPAHAHTHALLHHLRCCLQTSTRRRARSTCTAATRSCLCSWSSGAATSPCMSA